MRATGSKEIVLVWSLPAIPLLYYVALFGGAALQEHYSHARQYASELGAAGAASPWFFNALIVAAGFMAMAGGYALTAGLIALGGRRSGAVLAGISLAAWGFSTVMAGLYPMPDPRHGGWGVGLIVQLLPLLVILSIARLEGATGMKLLLAALFVGSGLIFSVMTWAGELVTPTNVGLWQRAYGATLIPWLGAIGLWLVARRRRATRTGAQLE